MSTHDLLDKLDGIGLISNVNRLTDSTFPGENPLVSRHRPGTNMKIETCPQNYKRKVKKNMDRRGRFRTQPITFSEIKEVDEDQAEITASPDSASAPRICSSSNENLNSNNSGSGLNLLPHFVKLRAKSEMDIKADFRPMSFPAAHHFRKRGRKQLKEKSEKIEDSGSDLEDEIGDKLGQLQNIITPGHQLAPNAPLVNPLWRSATPTKEFPI